MSATFAYIGNWGFSRDETPLGFAIASYSPTSGDFKILSSQFSEIRVGSTCLDSQRGILYCVNERPEIPGQTFGGQVLALKIDPVTGSLTELSRSPSYGPMPSDCAIDLSSQYLLVSNHSGRNSITKTVQEPDGSYRIIKEYDETAVVLFPLDSSGKIGTPCDIVRHTGHGPLPNQTSPHAHCVRRAPDSDLFIVCDKGNDSVYSYRIDRNTRKLIPCDQLKGLPGSSPRYCVFHPTQPYFYYNNETAPIISMVEYTPEGKLHLIRQISCVESISPGFTGLQSDLRISSNGKYLYTLIRENSTIAVYRITEPDYRPVLVQTVSCDSSKGGRWIDFSPDGRFLFLAACPDAQVYKFRIEEDGLLTPSGISATHYSPSTITFFTGKSTE